MILDKYFKHVFTLIAAVGLSVAVGCGEDTTETDRNTGGSGGSGGSTDLSYSDVALTLNNSCATSGCHDASSAVSGVDLSSAEGVAENAERSLIRINAGTMPPSGSAKTAFDSNASAKQDLINYLGAQ